MKKAKKQSSLMTKATILILILILPFNIIGMASSIMSYQNSVDDTRTSINYTVDSYAALLYNQVSNTHSMFYDLTHNNVHLFSMCTNTGSQYAVDSYKLFISVRDRLRVANAADAFFLYVEKEEDYIQIPGYTAETAGTKPYMKYITDFDYRYSQWFVSEDGTELIRVMYDNALDLYYGAAIDLNAFLNQLDGMDNYETLRFYVSDHELESSPTLVGFSSEVTKNVYLCASIFTRELYQQINVMTYAILLFFVIYFALIPVLLYLMRRYVDKPLNRLTVAHSQLEDGNEDYRITERSNSAEFDHAYASFNAMATSIQELHHAVMDKELSNKQLQIDFLQLQIRPHFLLNSFNVLYTLIQRGKRASAQDMVLFLSDYFRYLFRSGRELQLFAKERKLIEDYMNIAKIYYPVSFEVSYQLDPIIDLMRVPPLLLHSFMENIIAHALLTDRTVHIVFSGEYDDKLVTFYISDDGKGIADEELDAINHIAEQPLDNGKNVGIRNSIHRLKYYYGDEATVECTSELGTGTTFTITIPYNLEEDDNEPADCE